MSSPSVSVVVPLHNGERFLEAALESVLRQGYEPLELVVVDDGSEDDGPRIASRLGAEVLRLPHRGVAAARNAGVEAARGELVAFIDQDDVWPPGRLAAQVGHLRAHPELDYVLGRFEVFLEPGAVRPGWIRESGTGFLLGALLGRRPVFDRVGPFDTTLELSSDGDWFTRAKDCGVRWAALPHLVLEYRVHDGNASHARDLAMRERMRVLRSSVERQRRRQVDRG